MEVSIKEGWNCIKIYINNQLHVAIEEDNLAAIQTFLTGDGENRSYNIEYHLKKGGVIKSYYWTKESFNAILEAIDKFNIF